MANGSSSEGGERGQREQKYVSFPLQRGHWKAAPTDLHPWLGPHPPPQGGTAVQPHVPVSLGCAPTDSQYLMRPTSSSTRFTRAATSAALWPAAL